MHSALREEIRITQFPGIPKHHGAMASLASSGQCRVQLTVTRDNSMSAKSEKRKFRPYYEKSDALAKPRKRLNSLKQSTTRRPSRFCRMQSPWRTTPRIDQQREHGRLRTLSFAVVVLDSKNLEEIL